MSAKKKDGRGIYFGCVTVEWGNRRHNFFFSGMADSRTDAKKRGLKSCRLEFPASRWRAVNRVAYRIGDELVAEAVAALA